MESLQHLLILCCYGGAPYIDYQPAANSLLATAIGHEATRMVDPTDWIAVDSTGSLLNSTIHPEILAANPHLADLIPRNSEVLLEQCDLYNLTFSSLADEHLFQMAHGKLNCRCPKGRAGRSCELSFFDISSASKKSSQIEELLNMNSTSDSSEMLMPSEVMPLIRGHPNSFAIYLVLFLFFMLVIAAIFMMMRGCLCDCFGGFKNPFSSNDRYNRPIDPIALNRCLESVKAHEQNEKNKYMIESKRPLISSVSENCPYNPPVQPVIFPGEAEVRSHSPPPSYRSLNASLEFLPSPSTKL